MEKLFDSEISAEKAKEKGNDTEGNKYDSVEEVWKFDSSLSNGACKSDKSNIADSKEDWYKKGNEYWNNVSKDDNGVLQGFGSVSYTDLDCSSQFLKRWIKNGKLTPHKAIDCGGGIGRISGGMLVKFFEKVDIVDQAENLIKAAKEKIKDTHMRNFYVSGLQDFKFQDKYDCIWVQWVLLHLTDDDAIKFLTKCKGNLEKNVYLNFLYIK